MAERQYNKWLDYCKWYEKQQRKGFALSDQAFTWYDSYKNYLRQYEYAKELKAKNSEEYRDKSFYDIIKSRSYESSSRQTEYFYNRVAGILAELEEDAAGGSTEAQEKLIDFFAKFGDIRTADKQQIIYQHLKQGSLEYVYIDAKHHGWHGNLMDMMVYFQNNGIVDQIYV